MRSALIAALALVAMTGASGTVAQPPRLIQPGAPGEASREITVEEATDTSGVGYRPADVRFVHGMIGHHAQAVEMVGLVATRTANEDLRRLALRIEVSQKDEMQMMRDWLERRGEPLPDPHAHHMAQGHMPGMLTAEQMSRLAAARGAAFDRLFLAGMIQHHEGALTMVKELFATAGGGQEPDLFDFASDIEADQAMEIARMGAMLKELGR